MTNQMTKRMRFFGLWGGLLGAILIQFLPRPVGMSSEAWGVVSLTYLMAVWWITEAIPIPVTSLLPIVVLPTFDILPIKQVATPYSSPIVLLLLGGFIIAKSVEKWNLHSRLALNIVLISGSNTKALVGGFLLASAVLSMWISNTATSIMLIPIGVSVALAIAPETKQDSGLVVSILLAIAYGASIGGLGTPIGTPTNLIVIGYLQEHSGSSIDFGQWMLIGVPTVLLLLPMAWFVLTHWGMKLDLKAGDAAQKVIKIAIQALGPMSKPEARTMIVFFIIALAWMFRRQLNTLDIFGVTPFEHVTDHIIAIAGVILMFLTPSGAKEGESDKLLDWDTAKEIPWGVMLLFGGGLSLALAISQSGLAVWLADLMGGLTDAPELILLLALIVFVVFSTEIVSNVAAATAILPVIGALSNSSDINMLSLAIPVALAASCAFMLPMATGPNATVFASNYISIPKMAVIGLKLNLLAIAVILAVVWWLMPSVFSLQ